jgi:hypothetical protein
MSQAYTGSVNKLSEEMMKTYEYVAPSQQQVLDNLAESLMRSRREQFSQLLGQQPTAQVFELPVPRVGELAPIPA